VGNLITIYQDGRPEVMQIGDYVTRKTAEIKKVGYAVEEKDVYDDVMNLLSGKGTGRSITAFLIEQDMFPE